MTHMETVSFESDVADQARDDNIEVGGRSEAWWIHLVIMKSDEELIGIL